MIITDFSYVTSTSTTTANGFRSPHVNYYNQHLAWWSSNRAVQSTLKIMLNVVERKKETAVGYTLLFVATATVKLQKMTAVLGCLTTSARLTSQLTIQISPSFGGMIGGQKRSNLSFFVQGHSLYVVLIQPGKFSSRVSTKNTSRGCNSIIIWIFLARCV